MIKQFEVTSGKLVCSDPCYAIPTWCQGIVENVKNGVWGAEINLSDEGDWGQRVASLYIVNEDANAKMTGIETKIFEDEPLNFNAGVDSGQFGFFDFAHYRNDESAKDLKKYEFGDNYDTESGDAWYRACSDLTLGDEQWGVLPNGVVSSSGFGDGSYDVYGYQDAYGEYVAFAVVFIYDDEGDEYDDDEFIMSDDEDEDE
jgi:hypothetical protein